MESEPNQQPTDQYKNDKSGDMVAAQTGVGDELERKEAYPDGTEPPKPKRPYFWISIFKWIRRDAKATDWIIAIFTIVIAGVAYFQYTEMDDAGGQTDRMLHLVRNQLKEQHVAAEAAKNAAGATSTEAVNTGTLADRANDQTLATNRLANTTERSLEIAEGPLVGIGKLNVPDIQPDQDIQWTATLVNVGKGPAIQMRGDIGGIVICGTDPFPDNPAIPTSNAVHSAMTIFPGIPIDSAASTIHIIGADFQKFSSTVPSVNTCRLYLAGNIRYCDIFNHAHYQHFCGVWNPASTLSKHEISGCSTYNDSDRDHPREAPKTCPVP